MVAWWWEQDKPKLESDAYEVALRRCGQLLETPPKGGDVMSGVGGLFGMPEPPVPITKRVGGNGTNFVSFSPEVWAKLYALKQQVEKGPCTQRNRPWPWDPMVPGWDAWAELGTLNRNSAKRLFAVHIAALDDAPKPQSAAEQWGLPPDSFIGGFCQMDCVGRKPDLPDTISDQRYFPTASPNSSAASSATPSPANGRGGPLGGGGPTGSKPGGNGGNGRTPSPKPHPVSPVVMTSMPMPNTSAERESYVGSWALSGEYGNFREYLRAYGVPGFVLSVAPMPSKRTWIYLTGDNGTLVGSLASYTGENPAKAESYEEGIKDARHPITSKPEHSDVTFANGMLTCTYV